MHTFNIHNLLNSSNKKSYFFQTLYLFKLNTWKPKLFMDLRETHFDCFFNLFIVVHFIYYCTLCLYYINL